MEAVRAPAFRDMQVWDALGGGLLKFDSSYAGQSQLGWIMENRILQSALYERLLQFASDKRVDLLCPASVSQIILPPVPDEPALPAGARPNFSVAPQSLASLTLADGTQIQARLVVGADGAASKVREAARIGTWGWDYDQRAVVATVTTDVAHSTAFQRFLPNGPVAILPLWDNYSSIVWSTTPQHAEYLTSISSEQFADALNTVLTAPSESFAAAVRGEAAIYAPGSGVGGAATAASGGSDGAGAASTDNSYDRQRDAIWLDPISMAMRIGSGITDKLTTSPQAEPFRLPPTITNSIGPRASFPLRLMKANAYVKPRVALVGDAAHVVHPLAGQGLNLGLGDADELASVLASAAYHGGDVGSMGTLRKYESTRSAHNLLMMASMDSIKRIFSTPVGSYRPVIEGGFGEPFAVARNLGMAVLNSARPVKAQIAQLAMGGNV